MPALLCVSRSAFTPLRLIWPCVRPVFRRTGLISNPSLLVNSFPAVAYDAEVFNDVGCLMCNQPTKLVRILVGIQGFQRYKAKTVCYFVLSFEFKSILTMFAIAHQHLNIIRPVLHCVKSFQLGSKRPSYKGYKTESQVSKEKGFSQTNLFKLP